MTHLSVYTSCHFLYTTIIWQKLFILGSNINITRDYVRVQQADAPTHPDPELWMYMGPSIYGPTRVWPPTRKGGQARVDACGWGRGSSPMRTSTQKITIRVHWRHPVFFSCKEVGVFLPEFRLWME